MSLTAPIKPTPPAVPAVKLQPVESSSQNTAQSEPPAEKKETGNTLQKPAFSAKTEPAANNTTIINKVEPNDQNKVPLLNRQQKQETGNAGTDLNTTAVAEKPPAAEHKASGLDLYAALICVILFASVMLFLFWRHKALMREAKNRKPQGKAEKQQPGSKAAAPRTVVDYSSDNTKEIIDMLTGPAELAPENPKIKDKIKDKVTSNFEIRV